VIQKPSEKANTRSLKISNLSSQRKGQQLDTIETETHDLSRKGVNTDRVQIKRSKQMLTPQEEVKGQHNHIRAKVSQISSTHTEQKRYTKLTKFINSYRAKVTQKLIKLTNVQRKRDIQS